MFSPLWVCVQDDWMLFNRTWWVDRWRRNLLNIDVAPDEGVDPGTFSVKTAREGVLFPMSPLSP